MSPQVTYILRMMAAGRMTVPEARKRLRGMAVPDGPAKWIKEGMWASAGRYETGVRGARAAARDALDGAS